MILKDFEIEEIGPGQKIRLRCKVIKKHENKWREIRYQKEWDLNKNQRVNYPQTYMEFIQFCYQELRNIDKFHICITNEEQYKDGYGNALFDKEIIWE